MSSRYQQLEVVDSVGRGVVGDIVVGLEIVGDDVVGATAVASYRTLSLQELQ